MGHSTKPCSESSWSQYTPRAGQSHRSVKRSGGRTRRSKENHVNSVHNPAYFTTRHISDIVFSAGYELSFYELYPLLWKVEISWPNPQASEENNLNALYEDYRMSDHMCFLKHYELRRGELSLYAQPRKKPVLSVVPRGIRKYASILSHGSVQARVSDHFRESLDAKFQHGRRNFKTAHDHVIIAEPLSPLDDISAICAPDLTNSRPGSDTVEAWKSGAGRKKDWRRCKYTGTPVNGPRLSLRLLVRRGRHYWTSSARNTEHWRLVYADVPTMADIKGDVEMEESLYVDPLPKQLCGLILDIGRSRG